MKCNKSGFANVIIGYGATTGIGGGGGSCIGPHIKLIKGDCPLLLAHCTLLLAQKYYSTGPQHKSTTCNTFHTAACPQSTNITTTFFYSSSFSTLILPLHTTCPCPHYHTQIPPIPSPIPMSKFYPESFSSKYTLANQIKCQLTILSLDDI